MKFFARAATLCLALAVLATPVAAQTCKLTLLNSVALTPLGNDLAMLVPVNVNGTPKKMLLATGTDITTLNDATVTGLGLHALDGGFMKMLDGSGHATQRYVHIEDLQVGKLHGNIDVMIINVSGAPYDGMLGGNLMAQYDVDLDFAAHKLNYFSPDHCDGQVVYWPAAAVAVVPISLSRPMRENPGGQARFDYSPTTQIRVPVMLDGKPVTAIISTGASTSYMNAKTAKYGFGLTPESPGSIPMGMVENDPAHKIFGHVFSSLSFGGITVNNPHLTIYPDLVGSKDPDNTVSTGSLIKRDDDNLTTDVTIGMDVLRKLHVYIAYKEKKLYISPAAAPAPAANP